MTMPFKTGNNKQAMLDIMHAAKAAFCDRDVIGIVTSLCHGPLSKFPELSEEDSKLLQLYLTFVRNMAAIPDAVDCDKAGAKFHLSTLGVRTNSHTRYASRSRLRQGRAWLLCSRQCSCSAVLRQYH